MAPADPTTLDTQAVFTLVRSHLREPLVFTAADPGELPALVFQDDPRHVVGEILRLALIGAIAEAEHPQAPVSLVLHFANKMLERP